MNVTIESNAIIEAAARALRDELVKFWEEGDAVKSRKLAVVVLAAVTPLIEDAYVRSRATIHVAAIRNAALEEAAVVAEERRYFGLVSEKVITGAEIAAAIRALKEQP
jgi:hypothetical protein